MKPAFVDLKKLGERPLEQQARKLLSSSLKVSRLAHEKAVRQLLGYSEPFDRLPKCFA